MSFAWDIHVWNTWLVHLPLDQAESGIKPTPPSLAGDVVLHS